MKTPKILAIAVAANASLVLAFVYTNIVTWNLLNRFSLISGHWNPISTVFVAKSEMPGSLPLATVAELFSYPNYPFLLFFISTAINLYLIFRLQKSKETAGRNCEGHYQNS